MTTLDTYFVWMEELLALAEELVATTVGGAIEDAYVSPGLFAIDCCPFLTVYQTSIGEDLKGSAPAGQRHRYGRSSLFGVSVAVGRCVPTLESTGKAPEQAEQELAAQEIAQDGKALWDGIWASLRAGGLWAGVCSDVYWGQAVSLDPQGGCGGWIIPLRAQMDGVP